MSEPINFLSWDSRFFKRRIARVGGNRLTRTGISKILEQCRSQRIDCLYFLACSTDRITRQLAEETGFGLMDIRITLGLPLTRPTGTPACRQAGSLLKGEGLAFSLARRADIPALQKMAAPLFGDSRFAVDKNFPHDAAPRLFKEWIARSVIGKFDDCIWIARQGRMPMGFISCKITKEGIGNIGLLGVASRFQGQGLGAALVKQSLAWFTQKGATSADVVTQGSNIAAQRLYQKCGFRSTQVDLWYHKWFQPSQKHR